MSFINEETWIISDTHFFHHRIAKYANRPDGHNWIMLRNWQENIMPDDTVLHLGDVFLAKRTTMRRIAPFLTGNKYLVKGNHDSRRKMKKYVGFKVLRLHKYNCKVDGLVYTYYPATVNGIDIMFSHKPIPLDDLPDTINIHGHIHINPPPENMNYTDRHINMCVELHDYKPKRLGQVLEEYNENFYNKNT